MGSGERALDSTASPAIGSRLGLDVLNGSDFRRRLNPYVAIVALAGSLTLALVWVLAGTPAILAVPFFALGALYGSFNLVIFIASRSYRRLSLPRRAIGLHPKI